MTISIKNTLYRKTSSNKVVVVQAKCNQNAKKHCGFNDVNRKLSDMLCRVAKLLSAMQHGLANHDSYQVCSFVNFFLNG